MSKDIILVTGFGRSGSTAASVLLEQQIDRSRNVGELLNVLKGGWKGRCSCGKSLKSCDFWKKYATQAEKPTYFEILDDLFVEADVVIDCTKVYYWSFGTLLKAVLLKGGRVYIIKMRRPLKQQYASFLSGKIRNKKKMSLAAVKFIFGILFDRAGSAVLSLFATETFIVHQERLDDEITKNVASLFAKRLEHLADAHVPGGNRMRLSINPESRHQ